MLIGIFAVGCLGLWLADYSYPPVEQTRFFLGMIVLWFVGASILGWATQNDDDDNSNSHIPRKGYLVIAFIPWVACAAAVANAVMDSSAAVSHSTKVESRYKGRNLTEVKVVSWGADGKTRRIPVNDGCYAVLTPGSNMTVLEKDGALGMHWIAGIAECSRQSISKSPVTPD